MNKIVDIPPVQTVSCVFASCYLIDFEETLWSFGNNSKGQLGHGDRTNINAPKVINTIKDIHELSYGPCGEHIIAKNSQNQIFVAGNNDYGQLGIGDNQSVSTLKEINSQYFPIWGQIICRAKSARK